MITYHLKISGQDARILSSDMEFVAGDVGAYRMVFTFFDNGKRLALDGYSLAVKVRRADGVVLSDGGKIAGDTAEYIPQNACISVAGDVTFEIALADKNQNYITTKIITARVLESVGEPSDASGDNVSVYVSLLSQAQAKLEAANALLTETRNSLGDLETALLEIEAIADSLIGGDAE